MVLGRDVNDLLENEVDAGYNLIIISMTLLVLRPYFTSPCRQDGTRVTPIRLVRTGTINPTIIVLSRDHCACSEFPATRSGIVPFISSAGFQKTLLLIGRAKLDPNLCLYLHFCHINAGVPKVTVMMLVDENFR